MGTDANKTMAMLNIVNLRGSIDKLMLTESKSIAIVSLCNDYLKKLDGGQHEEELCESFVIELSKIATSDDAKKVLESLNESVKENENNISLAKDVYSLASGSLMYAAPIIESTVVEYMINKTPEARQEAKVSLSLFEGNSTVKSIIETINSESYQEKFGKALVNAQLKEEYKEGTPRTYTEDEVNAIIENRVSEAKKEASAPKAKKTLESMENRINLHGVIKNILKENSHNDKLRIFCEKYIKAMNEGKADEVLYESFISGISNWNYLNAVDTEMTALKSRISQYKQEIDLKKILEMMKQTGSYYIVPLIEDVVVDFAENKNMATKALMLQRLESFEYDPFVRDIMNIALRDQSIGDNVYLGESVELCNNYVKAEKIFSPIHYIKESETVFNVKGTYYKRTGDSISKLSKNDVSNLDESFVNLCSLVNSSNVVISEELNSITVYGGKSNKAVINENEIRINGSKIKTDSLDNLTNAAKMMNEKDDFAFYAAVKVLNENFDNIAKIDFVKRVSSKDNSGLCVDVFKINENICVNTINSALGKSIFYKNVNPIQCRNYINEHMGINVAPMFEDVLPDQENTKKNIDEKKKEYEDYIESLEAKKETLEKMKDEASDTDDIDKAIDMINKEIEDTKNDYKKYQKDADDFLNGKKEDSEEDDELKDQKVGDDKSDDSDDADDSDDQKEKDKEQTDEEPKESPEDMEQPITEPDEDDEFGVDVPDEYADVPEFDPDFDMAIATMEVPSDGGHAQASISGEDVDGYKVVRVSYNKNVKTGKTSNKGEVIVIIPSVDANGDVHDDMRKITFILDANHSPIVNNEYMPLAMYNAIVNAIEAAPETENVSVDEPDGGDDNGGGMTIPEEPVASTEEVVDAVVPVEGEPQEKDAPSLPSTDETSTEVTSDSKKNSTPVEPAKQETPAKTQEEGKKDKYPIAMGFYPEDIAPMEMSDFESHLDKMNIEHSANEDGDGGICMKVGNKAQKEAFKKFVKEWFNYDDKKMKSFIPELCENEISECGAVQEGVKISSVRAVNEAKNDFFRVIVPVTEAYKKMFNLKNVDDSTAVTIIAENEKEAQDFYNRLYEHSLNNEVEQDVQDILEHFAPKYKENAERIVKYDLNVPYNGFLESKLIAKGYDVKRLNENMSVEILKSDYLKTKKLLKSVYGNEIPEKAKEFIDFVNEALIITIKDESTGKSVEINADTVTSSGNDSAADESADFESSFKDTTTFEPEKSMLFKDDEESADDDEKKKDESEEEEKKVSKDGTPDEKKEEDSEKKSSDESDEEEDKPKKKVFKFKAKKSEKKEESNESVKEGASSSLNEEAGVAKTTVLDFVEIPDGRKGQVISQLADGTLIVNVQGHTLPFQVRELKALKKRPDTLDFPVKFDPLTLKGVIESYVSCGMFLNNVQVTPNDCKVKLLEFVTAKENDEINIIIEGESTKATKKYIRITENLNDVLDLANYAEGKMALNIEGVLTESDVLVNIKDYMKYKNVNEETCPVRTLVYDESGETHLRYINGTQLRLNESSDIYVPEYINDLNRAMLLTK